MLTHRPNHCNYSNLRVTKVDNTTKPDSRLRAPVRENTILLGIYKLRIGPPNCQAIVGNPTRV